HKRTPSIEPVLRIPHIDEREWRRALRRGDEFRGRAPMFAVADRVDVSCSGREISKHGSVAVDHGIVDEELRFQSLRQSWNLVWLTPGFDEWIDLRLLHVTHRAVLDIGIGPPLDRLRRFGIPAPGEDD